MTKNLKTFPKLQTQRIFPSAEFKRKSKSLAIGSYMNAVIVLPKDFVNILILGAGGLGLAADGLSPIPLGEAIFRCYVWGNKAKR